MAKKKDTATPSFSPAAAASNRDIRSKKELSPHLLSMLFNEPFFARICRSINIEFGSTIPTAGVMVKDGDVHMLCNPDFMSSLSDIQIKGLLKHECFHLAYEHCTSRRLEPAQVGNIAADLAINSEIPFNELPEGGLVPGKVPAHPEFANSPLGKLIASFPLCMPQEWYHSRILQDDEASAQAQASAGECGFGFDDHEGWGKMSDEEKEIVKAKIRDSVAAAVRECDRTGQWGNVSSDMRAKLREMISKEVDWRSILKQFCGMSKRGTRTTTWSNMNMVHVHPDFGPIAPGAKRGFTSSIAVYIDQSGSVGDRELQLAFGELKQLARHTEFVTFHFDTSVDEKSETKWNKRRGVAASRTRCGGTDFDCVTEHANKNRSRFDGYIIITDSEAPKPKPSKLKRCWLLVPGCKMYFEKDAADFVSKMKFPGAGA